MCDHISAAESSAKVKARSCFPRRAVIAHRFAPRVILKMNIIMKTHTLVIRKARVRESAVISIDNL